MTHQCLSLVVLLESCALLLPIIVNILNYSASWSLKSRLGSFFVFLWRSLEGVDECAKRAAGTDWSNKKIAAIIQR